MIEKKDEDIGTLALLSSAVVTSDAAMNLRSLFSKQQDAAAEPTDAIEPANAANVDVPEATQARSNPNGQLLAQRRHATPSRGMAQNTTSGN